MALNAAKEQAVRESVRRALLVLADGNPHTRVELFGQIPDRTADHQRTTVILTRLRERELITSDYASSNKAEMKLHMAKDAAAVRAIAVDEIELSRLIWPGRTPAKVVPEQLAPVVEEASANDNMTDAAPNTDQLMGEMFKLIVALTQNVIYVREKVDALNSVACSHCGDPAAHGAMIGANP